MCEESNTALATGSQRNLAPFGKERQDTVTGGEGKLTHLTGSGWHLTEEGHMLMSDI